MLRHALALTPPRTTASATTTTPRRASWLARLRSLAPSSLRSPSPFGRSFPFPSSPAARNHAPPRRGQQQQQLLPTDAEAVLDKVAKGRGATELMLRCTVLDARGNVTSISGLFKKSDLCAEHRLNPRDLRKIDSRVPNLVPTILVRRAAFLVNILHIRALVKADTVILFDSFGSADSRLHSVFLYHLEHNLRTGAPPAPPYEFRALESILLSVLAALEAEMVFTRTLVGGLLAEMDDAIDHDRFKRLLHYSRRLAAFKNRAQLVGEAIDEVLAQDEDMDAMHLSERARAERGGAASEGGRDHEELEVLLESFSKQVEEIVNEAESIENNVQSTQEIVELILDANRNALLALDLKVSILTLGVGSGALLAGVFGMNLLSGAETHPHAFVGACAAASLLVVGVAWAGLRRLAQIRRVGLASGGAPAPRGRRLFGFGGGGSSSGSGSGSGAASSGGGAGYAGGSGNSYGYGSGYGGGNGNGNGRPAPWVPLPLRGRGGGAGWS